MFNLVWYQQLTHEQVAEILCVNFPARHRQVMMSMEIQRLNCHVQRRRRLGNPSSQDICLHLPSDSPLIRIVTQLTFQPPFRKAAALWSQAGSGHLLIWRRCCSRVLSQDKSIRTL